MRYLVVIEEGATSFGAYVPDLPGCVAAFALPNSQWSRPARCWRIIANTSAPAAHRHAVGQREDEAARS